MIRPVHQQIRSQSYGDVEAQMLVAIFDKLKDQAKDRTWRSAAHVIGRTLELILLQAIEAA